MGGRVACAYCGYKGIFGVEVDIRHGKFACVNAKGQVSNDDT